MKKTLFLITHSDIGGAGRHVLFSAKKLKEDGFNIFVGAGNKGLLAESLAQGGIPVVLFKCLKRSLNPVFAMLFALELRKFIKKEKIDKINFNSSNTLLGIFGLWGLKERPKTTFTVHGLSYLSPGFKKSKIIKLIVWFVMKIFLSLIDEVIFVCNYDKELAEKMRLIKKGQGRVVYNEIDNIDFLEKKEAISRLRKIREFPENKIIVGTITRLEYAKNNEMLIEAFGKIQSDNAICLIIGDGPDRENLKSQISNLKINDRVFLMGNIPDASKYLKAFDVFVMTSRYEGMPYALLEAQAAELPIIATRVGGIPEILKETLIEPDDVGGLVNALKKLFS